MKDRMGSGSNGGQEGDGPRDQFENAEWKSVSFADMQKTLLSPFQVITDIKDISSFRLVEEHVCRSIVKPLLPGASPSDIEVLLSKESRIMEDRITNHLRPDGIRGSTSGAKAIILPLDSSRLEKGTRKIRDDTPGLRVIYYIENLRTSKTGSLGLILREATYFLGRPIPERSFLDWSDYLTRSILPSVQVEEASKIVRTESAVSTEVAKIIAGNALRNAYSAGAPGLGKRR